MVLSGNQPASGLCDVSMLVQSFMDGAMRETRETAGKIGVRLIDDRRKHEWIVEWLMFADDAVLLGDEEKKLQRLVNEFERVCKKRKLTVNVKTSKVMKVR